MRSSRFLNKTLAIALIVGVQLLVSPAPAATPSAALSGRIVSADARAPVPGVVVRMVDPGTGDLYTSPPTDDKGAFTIAALPPSTYSLTVQRDQGAFLAGTPVVLAPGQHRSVQVAIFENGAAPSPEAAQEPMYKTSAWENPLTATLIALGIAVVLGVTIEELFGSDSKKKKISSPSAP